MTFEGGGTLDTMGTPSGAANSQRKTMLLNEISPSSRFLFQRAFSHRFSWNQVDSSLAGGAARDFPVST